MNSVVSNCTWLSMGLKKWVFELVPSNHRACVAAGPVSEAPRTELDSTLIFPSSAGRGAIRPFVGTESLMASAWVLIPGVSPCRPERRSSRTQHQNRHHCGAQDEDHHPCRPRIDLLEHEPLSSLRGSSTVSRVCASRRPLTIHSTPTLHPRGRLCPYCGSSPIVLAVRIERRVQSGRATARTSEHAAREIREPRAGRSPAT